MQAEELARQFEQARREGKAWRARCPVHGGKSLTLAIYSGEDRCFVHCFAGCNPDDILKAVNLTWKDLYYQPRARLSREAWIAQQRIREAKESQERIKRIAEWIEVFCELGYTIEDRQIDLACYEAWWIIGKGQPTRGWLNHMYRIMAGDICATWGWLPKTVIHDSWPEWVDAAKTVRFLTDEEIDNRARVAHPRS